jgi:HD-like signal output (HDOD) protein/CheY-like chemotaxis protein
MNAATPKPEAARRRLLFVDDETLVLQGLKRSLHSMRAQWEMNFVESGAAALEALSRESYDAIITDMRMPVMDGAQLLDTVKEKYPEVVRMVLSGQANRETVLRSLGPAHQYVSKPCDPQELKTRLAQAFLMRDLLKNSSVRALVLGLKSIPSPPALYHEIQSELQSEDVSLKRIADTVSKDAGMTAKILQLANSAFMGARFTVSNPTQAITLIGTEMVRALVLSVHVFSQFKDPAAADCATLWEHGIAVSCLAQRIATSEKCAKTVVDECSTAGILHEIGKLVLLAEMPRQYAEVLAAVTKAPGCLTTAEREHFGCTHAELGAYLMSIWGLPHPLIHAVAYHDCPSASIEDSFSSLTIIHAADALVSSCHSELVLQDVQLDEKYIAALNRTERLPLWREFYEQRMEGKKT